MYPPLSRHGGNEPLPLLNTLLIPVRRSVAGDNSSGGASMSSRAPAPPGREATLPRRSTERQCSRIGSRASRSEWGSDGTHDVCVCQSSGSSPCWTLCATTSRFAFYQCPHSIAPTPPVRSPNTRHVPENHISRSSSVDVAVAVFESNELEIKRCRTWFNHDSVAVWRSSSRRRSTVRRHEGFGFSVTLTFSNSLFCTMLKWANMLELSSKYVYKTVYSRKK